MSEERVVEVKSNILAVAHIDDDTYRAMYARSIEAPEAFWAEQAELYVTWFKRWNKVADWNFST